MFPASSVCKVGPGQKELLLWGGGGGTREGEGMCQVSPEKVRGRSDNANKGIGGIGVRSGDEGL